MFGKWMRMGVLLVVGLLVAGCAQRPSLAPTVVGQQVTAVAPTAVTAPVATEAAAAASAATDAAATEAPAGAVPTRLFAGAIAAPEFPIGLEWLNAKRPLTLAELRGKVVLLDFWTYGCINCMHVIPDLKRLEEKYGDALVVIGVHSAKFSNERETENIRQIIRRYELTHPVINDRDFLVWNAYGARAWPTFVLIDPAGNVFGYETGEGIYDLFDRVIGGMIVEFGAAVERTPLDVRPAGDDFARSPLLFPGKVLADGANGRLFIADSNHNRIVVTDLDGRVLDVIGSGRAGLQDGGYETAAFHGPQGLALAGADTLYVADTRNHAVRRVNLATRLVETAAGTGVQGAYLAASGDGPETPLNSPWDVVWHNGRLFIAMAGQHQIWTYDPVTARVRAFAGSGREELVDGPLARAGFNQPSGLAAHGPFLYVADSEASAIRVVDLELERVETIVGVGLFDFGDVDGVGDVVRLQHPLGVAVANGALLLADTYNHKIKRLDPQTQRSETLLGGGQAGWRDGGGEGAPPLFAEPGGLSVAGDWLYVADTNNHVIRIANLETGKVSTLVLADPDGRLTRVAADAPFPGRVITLEARPVAAGSVTALVTVTLPEGYKLNDIAPFLLEIMGEGVDVGENGRFQAVAPEFPVEIPLTVSAGAANVQADLVIYYCEAEAESLCFIEQVRLLLPLTVTVDGAGTLTISHAIPTPPG